MFTVKKTLVWGWMLCAALAGCATSPPEPVDRPAPEPKPQLTETQKRERYIADLLYGAERALSRDRLMMPGYDNAYDRYSSVLALEPNNSEAKLGMQAIVLRYLDMARNAAQRSYFDKAQAYLDRASGVLPDNAAVQSLVDQQREALAKPEPRLEAQNAHRLSTTALAKRTDEIKQQLAHLAQTAKEHNHMVLIVTGSDGQGRWVYQTMRKAVPGYLLRGDIQVGAPARIELLPPL
ncbi:hypothetical protein KO507_07775 [Gilvimarinus agarilyticus]|uniref:hypothetical protein n=1 Tax=Gilvimarinus sp. 2_MG-2023 TaxID=3062666 RepID=UPI001C08B933|nr:hypothetical protein [Gilvimarinus sp. 2_MG-2023]MBU2885658.1 hypothetical protein [Gilvimarinus agarilyticus]MDO6570517.1 hypothetical protein [Gilvimarinus sp. 2_MG-2023]